MQLQSKHDSATSFVDAGNAYKKADPQGEGGHALIAWVATPGRSVATGSVGLLGRCSCSSRTGSQMVGIASAWHAWGCPLQGLSLGSRAPRELPREWVTGQGGTGTPSQGRAGRGMERWTGRG